MQIFFDPEFVVFDIIDCEISPIIERMMSHLRHVDIPFRSWDNPYAARGSIDSLIEFGRRLGLDVDREKCVARDQTYLNFLHSVYEKNYDGNPQWLDYHENIHFCEERNSTHRYLNLDFREKGGLLEKFFDIYWLKDSTHRIQAGDIFVQWAELGKIPYSYWCDKEPNDIERIKTLCKPWLKLRTKICVSLEDYDYYTASDDFDLWWAQYHDAWCQHWQIPKWDLLDMESRLIIGHMPLVELDRLKKLLRSGKIPRRLLP